MLALQHAFRRGPDKKVPEAAALRADDNQVRRHLLRRKQNAGVDVIDFHGPVGIKSFGRPERRRRIARTAEAASLSVQRGVRLVPVNDVDAMSGIAPSRFAMSDARRSARSERGEKSVATRIRSIVSNLRSPGKYPTDVTGVNRQGQRRCGGGNHGSRSEPKRPRSLHPLEAFLLAGSVPLFLGVLLSDLAYGSSYEIQWKNFASWLIVGALVFGGFALLWALIDLLRARSARASGRSLYFLFCSPPGSSGFINALVHAKDAWASMPAALILSVIVTVLASPRPGSAFPPFAREERDERRPIYLADRRTARPSWPPAGAIRTRRNMAPTRSFPIRSAACFRR